MATITTATQGDLTNFTCVDVLSVEDILHTINNHYIADKVKHVVWDFTKSSLAEITTGQFRSIAATVGSVRRVCGHGKTAFVCGSDVDFGMCRMYATLTDCQDVDADYMVFKDLDKANEWMKNCVAAEV